MPSNEDEIPPKPSVGDGATAQSARLRRTAYRAAYRGTKEMDHLMGRYADANLAGMNETTLELFERLLAEPDPTVQKWIMSGEKPDKDDYLALIADVRRFHGLE